MIRARQEAEGIQRAEATRRNVCRLEAIMALFRLDQADIVRATGYSRAYVSRCLNEPGFGTTDRFWTRLNSRLPDLLREGAGQVFEVGATTVPERR